MIMEHVAVVGASLAGLRACETLRAEGFAGRITVIGAEDVAFYDRPPLSKKFLAGEWDVERIALRKPEAIDALNLDVRVRTRAQSLNASTRTLTVDDGSTLVVDGIVIATGGEVRKLPNQPALRGVHVLRSVNDASTLRDSLTADSRLVVIGAGFIGLEAAATAAQRGVHVTVLEGLPAPLVRALGAEMGEAVARVHSRNGVSIRCGVSVAQIIGDDHVTGVQLSDGEVVEADNVLVGIGVAPATSWLEGSGLTLRDGVVCDATLNAGAPGVFAAGDVARWPNGLFSFVEPDMRVEHWTNAAEQGAAAARNLLAMSRGESGTPYAAVPFFWSDQFDARIQFLGRTKASAVVDVVAGSVDDGKFCAMYSVNDRLCGVLGVSMPKHVMPSRALLSTSTSRDEALAHFASL